MNNKRGIEVKEENKEAICITAKKEENDIEENEFIQDEWGSEDETSGMITVEKTSKELLNRICVFVSLAIVVVASSSVCGILIAEASHREEVSVIEKPVIESTPEPTPIIPVYSEEAKERMKNIYKSELKNEDNREEENDSVNSEVQNIEKVAYLTFDDGPSSSVTPQILEILKNEGVKATFFVLGSRAELYPELVKQEYDEGHYIANHGYSHNYKSIYSSVQAILDEYNSTEEKIKIALGNENYSSHLFRFPGGSEGGKYAKIKDEAKGFLEENSILYINWNCLTNDSVGKPTYESVIKDFKITQNGKDKIVVLMHDTGAKQITADSLPEIISYLKEQGYVFKNFYDIMY
jgi:peptidoglycan/xylan/chitin deacetylase (PgdA/CDA1 family)